MMVNLKTLKPGFQKVKLDIANLPSGTQIDMDVHITKSAKDGPTLLLTAGLHGDEVNGIETTRRFMQEEDWFKPTAGTVIVIPILNIYGFINFSREVPDGKDVNRSFPGNSHGSLASRVAHTLMTNIIPQIDLGLDFHTGGASRYNYPQVRYYNEDTKAQKFALSFNAPLTLANTPPLNSFRREAYETGKTILVFEGAETLRFDKFSIDEGLRGIKNVMIDLGMIEGEKLEKPSLVIDKSHWIRAEKSGMFVWDKQSGEKVNKDDVLGHIHQIDENDTIAITTKYSGFIIGHNNSPVVSQGDALFHVGS